MTTIVAKCVDCPFSATDVDTVFGHANFCHHPHGGQRFEGDGSRTEDLPEVPPGWCGLRIGAVVVELKKGV